MKSETESALNSFQIKKKVICILDALKGVLNPDLLLKILSLSVLETISYWMYFQQEAAPKDDGIGWNQYNKGLQTFLPMQKLNVTL